VLVEIFFPVVVAELFAWLDKLPRLDEDVSAPETDLAIGSARVIDVASGVDGGLPIYRPLLRDLEEVLAPAGIDLFRSYRPTYILDYPLPFPVGTRSEESESGV
jgi:hypothetical protein